MTATSEPPSPAQLNAERINQFAQEQEVMAAAMALLIDEWAAMLAALRRVEVEVGKVASRT